MMELDLLQVDLTDECPLFCSHCSNSSGPRLSSKIQVTAVEEAILDAFHLGCRNVVFSGGEPLRYAELPRLLALCKRADLISTIFTTGIRDLGNRLPISCEDWMHLKKSGLDSAIFSSYASPTKREFHDRIVRLRPQGDLDAFGANELAIARCLSAGINVELQFIPSDETCSDLPSIAIWASGLGVSRLHLQYPTNQGRNRLDPSLVINSESEAILRADASALFNEAPILFHVSRLWRLKWGIDEGAKQRQIIVRSDGTVVLCNACKYLVEALSQKNIYEQTLGEVWNDEVWREASCGCSTHADQRVGKATPNPRGPGLHLLRTHGVLTPGTE